MIYEQKVLTYKGEIVFEKIVMSRFKRIPKLYQKNEACFMFINQGEFSVRSAKNFLSFKKGKALLAKCFNYFFETNRNQRENSKYFEVLGVLIHPFIVEEIFKFNLSDSNFKIDFNVKQVNVDPLLLNFKENINFLLDNPSLADDELIKTKLKEFILLISKTVNAPSELDFLAAMFSPIEYNFKKTIKNNLYSNLSINELAKLCNMSISSFKRKFKETYQESPRKFISKKKLEKASYMLLYKENRIIDISYDCGFESITTFNRLFKKQFNTSPTSYRMNQID